MTRSLGLTAAFLSLVIFVLFVGIWQLATRGSGPVAQMDP